MKHNQNAKLKALETSYRIYPFLILYLVKMSIHINKPYFIIQQQHKALTIMIFTSSVPLARGPRKKNYTMFNSFVASAVLLCREVTTIY